jgi:branched-chain amino acid transport system ATP-binding protein
VTAILEVRNLETHYGPIPALRGVSLAVEQGQIVTVLGANGAGKTTLLNTIAGVLDPSKGVILLDGREIQRQQPDAVARRGIGLVPEGRHVFPFLSVDDNLRMGAYARGDGAIAEDRARMFALFPRLRERRTIEAGLLSGGEQQMLAIARALMARPRLMLLDEPSLGLAPLLVQEIFRTIQAINAELGTAVLVVEQNARIALDYAEFGYVMELGRIVMAERCESLRERPDIRDFYLGAGSAAVDRQRWKRRKTWR